MADESSPHLEGKCLSTLRVVDLKMELEKRGLSKSGSKKDLIKRLKQKLELEKLFEVSTAVGASEPKLQLDEATEQNEFVKRYLAEQQEILASQREARRLIELREQEGTTEDSDSGFPDQNEEIRATTDEEEKSGVTEDDEVCAIKDQSGESAILLKNTESKEQEKDNCVQSADVDSGLKETDTKTDYIEISVSENLGDDVSENKPKRDKSENLGMSEDVCDSTTLSENEELENKSKPNETNIIVPEKSETSSTFVKEHEITKHQEHDITKRPLQPSESEIIDLGNMPKDKKTKASHEPVSYSLADICLPESSKHNKAESFNKELDEHLPCDTDDGSSRANGTTASLFSEGKSRRRKSGSHSYVERESTKDSVIPVPIVQANDSVEHLNIQNENMDVTENINPAIKKPEDGKNSDNESKSEDDLKKIPTPLEISSDSVNKDSLHHSQVRTKGRINEKNSKNDSKSRKEVFSDDERKKRRKGESISKYKQVESRDSRKRIKEKSSRGNVSPKRSRYSSSSSSTSSSSSSTSSSSSSEAKSHKKKQDRLVPQTKSKERLDYQVKSKQLSASKNRDKKMKLDGKSPTHVTSNQKERVKIENRKSFSRSRSHDSSEKEQSSKLSSDQYKKEKKNKRTPSPKKFSDHEQRTEVKEHVHQPMSETTLHRSLSRSVSKEKHIEEKSHSRDPSPVLSKTEDRNRSVSHSPSPEHSAYESDVSSKKKSWSPEEQDVSPKKKSWSPEEKNAHKSPHLKSEENESEVIDSKRRELDTVDEDVISAEIERNDELLQERDEMKTDDNQDVDMKEEGELGSEENTEAEMEIQAHISYRKLNIPFKRTDSKDKQQRRRWSVKHAVPKSSMNISSESLKNLLPNFKLVCPKPKVTGPEEKPSEVEPVSKSMSETEEKSHKKPAARLPSLEDDIAEKGGFSCALFMNCLSASTFKKKLPIKKQLPAPIKKKEEVFINKKEKFERPEPMDEDMPPITKSLAKPASCIIFIQNLVRPFTLLQLKDMLAQTGTIVKDGFWIDKIKSKCFVKYDKLEDAIKTRELLDGSKWPVSNPKILVVEFATQEEFDLHAKAYDLPQPPPGLTSGQQEIHKREESRESSDARRRLKKPEHSRDREREREQRAKNVYVREWDKDKLSQDSPERENIRPHGDVDRSERKREKRETRKKTVEETPAKLLDDLFKKTKATPCIYWLPLTEEQAKKKEDERRQRRLDREKRNQQEEAERRARRKQREKASRSRSRSRTGRRR